MFLSILCAHLSIYWSTWDSLKFICTKKYSNTLIESIWVLFRTDEFWSYLSTYSSTEALIKVAAGYFLHLERWARNEHYSARRLLGATSSSATCHQMSRKVTGARRRQGGRSRPGIPALRPETQITAQRHEAQEQGQQDPESLQFHNAPIKSSMVLQYMCTI